MWLDSLLQDLRYVYRTLRRDVGFAAFAILIVALGIGASSTVFSVVNALLVRPLPFKYPLRLAWVANHDVSGLSGQTTQVQYLIDLRSRAKSLSEVAGYMAFYGVGDNLLSSDGAPERLSGVPVSENFFQVLGVQPQIGRLFTAGECKGHGPKAVILGHGLWSRRFAEDPSIVGRKLVINGEPYEVAGVVPSAKLSSSKRSGEESAGSGAWSFILRLDTHRAASRNPIRTGSGASRPRRAAPGRPETSSWRRCCGESLAA